MKKTISTALAVVAACAFAVSANAIPFELKTSLADKVESGTAPDGFYKVNFGPDGEEGPKADVFATTWGNLDDEDEPFSATVTWTGNKPTLTVAYLKASTSLYIWDNPTTWNVFNTDSSYTSILFTHDDPETSSNIGAGKAISHVGLDGTVTSVPDGGVTLALLGLSLLGLLGASRRFVKRA